MMTTLQFALFFTASLVTFFSYQAIPRALERKRDSLLVRKIVTSPVFTVFVRACGVDHLVMAFLMGVMIFQPERWSEAFAWVLVVSAWIVAVVSALSAIAAKGHDV